MKYEAPIWEKANLNIEEAAAYFGIGMNKLRELTEDEQCKFVLFVGTKRLIKRRLFEQYLEQAYTQTPVRGRFCHRTGVHLFSVYKAFKIIKRIIDTLNVGNHLWFY